MRISIRARLAVAMWLPVAAVVVAGTMVAERTLRTSLESEQHRQLQEAARRIDSAQERDDRQLEDKVQYSLAAHPSVLGVLDGSLTAAELEDLRSAVEVDLLAVVSPFGQLVGAPRGGMQVRDVPWDLLFRDALERGRPGKDMVRRGATFETRGVQPVRRGGEVVGAVMGSYVLDHTYLQRILEDTGLHAAFVYEASILATTLPAFERIDSRAVFAAKEREAREARGEEVQEFVRWPLELDGEPYDAVFCTLYLQDRSAHLGLLVLLASARPLELASTRARTQMLATGAAGLLLATLLAALAAIGLSRPIRRLALAAHAMRAGDLARRTGIRRHDEIGELGRAFDEMAESLEEHVEQVRQLAVTDELTGLANRRRFVEELRREVNRHKRFESVMCVVFLDIDHFKQVNDTYGHAEGDEVLVAIADALREGVRSVDVPCRHGGEEFAVILPNTDLAAAVAVAERLRAAVAQQPMGRDGQVHVTLSAGVSIYPEDGSSAEQLLEVADQRLYQAKEGGRNRVVYR